MAHNYISKIEDLNLSCRFQPLLANPVWILNKHIQLPWEWLQLFFCFTKQGLDIHESVWHKHLDQLVSLSASTWEPHRKSSFWGLKNGGEKRLKLHLVTTNTSKHFLEKEVPSLPVVHTLKGEKLATEPSRWEQLRTTKYTTLNWT